MKHLLSYIENWLFGPEIVYKYQNGTKVPNELIHLV